MEAGLHDADGLRKGEGAGLCGEIGLRDRGTNRDGGGESGSTGGGVAIRSAIQSEGYTRSAPVAIGHTRRRTVGSSVRQRAASLRADLLGPVDTPPREDSTQDDTIRDEDDMDIDEEGHIDCDIDVRDYIDSNGDGLDDMSFVISFDLDRGLSPSIISHLPTSYHTTATDPGCGPSTSPASQHILNPTTLPDPPLVPYPATRPDPPPTSIPEDASRPTPDDTHHDFPGGSRTLELLCGYESQIAKAIFEFWRGRRGQEPTIDEEVLVGDEAPVHEQPLSAEDVARAAAVRRQRGLGIGGGDLVRICGF
ncbi:hypothetical protein V2J09_000589 [Rumex salicifolius]